jgi:hypothetical protein
MARISQSSIASDLKISTAEIGASLKRLIQAKLIDQAFKPIRKNVTEFLVYGFKYAFPPEMGPLTRGLATSHAAPPLDKRIKFSPEDIFVWPDANGETRGQSLVPLYSSVVVAAKKDVQLYEFLALLDALRVGRLREIQLATDELKKRIRAAT